MNNKEIIQKLDKLADLQAHRDVLALQKQEIVDQVLTPEIKEKLLEIDAEFGDKLESVNTNIAELEQETKKAVIEMGETIRGQFIMAVWAKGRISWDTKALDGFATAHPEILQFRKTGDPSVSLRKI
jgi:hypothetical protein